jgi:hypoxanthine-DNA glycosylase
MNEAVSNGEQAVKGLPAMPLQGFPWVADSAARVLVLGSMPGIASLTAERYYAHPRNLFWDVMGELFGAGRELPYARRLVRLREVGVALWDVVHRCRRQGSLDTAIDRGSVEANDFAALYDACPQIRAVFFNGTAARDLYRRHVLPRAPQGRREIDYTALPSTSPAHAALGREAKVARWRCVSAAFRGSG